MKLAFFSTQAYDRQYFDRYNSTNEIAYFDAPLQEQTTNLADGAEAVCVFVNDQVNAVVINALSEKGVRLILLRCAGFNNVDVQAAKEKGIQIARVPEYSPHAVAEHTVALILTLNRKTHKAYNRVREGNFSLLNLSGFDLYRKTAGVIGLGKIGKVYAEIMLGFGCKVLGYDIIKHPDLEARGVSSVSLDELFAQSDIITLHCPLTEQTRHLINAGTIDKMKSGVMLINTGRGALIDAPAVIEGLKKGKIGYLGLDVYEQEDKLFFRDLSADIIKDDTIMRLMSFPNVLITAHQAFFTDEALTEITKVTLKNIDDYQLGTLSTTLVN